MPGYGEPGTRSALRCASANTLHESLAVMASALRGSNPTLSANPH